MKRGLLVVAAAATLLGGVAGCSNNTSTASPSTTPNSSPTVSPNGQAAKYKVVINGQDITYPFEVLCQPAVSQGNETANTSIVAGHAEAEVTPDNQAVMVTLEQHTENGTGNINMWKWLSMAARRGRDHGDASVTKNGKNYKITGHITPVRFALTSDEFFPIGSPVPFEFDVTCP